MFLYKSLHVCVLFLKEYLLYSVQSFPVIKKKKALQK